MERCVGKGLLVQITDSAIQLEDLVGSNRRHALSRIAHLAELFVADPEELTGDLLVLGHPEPRYARFCRELGPDRAVLDLIRLISPSDTGARYIGLSW